ncbi:MAG: hypothetical protein KC646_09440 [Candidatus Cloacimonetes bacterium]|nr:hypothetical protein [Candidatus Cloacimonadota bacterium]
MKDHKPLGIKLLTSEMLKKYEGVQSALGDTLQSINKEGFKHSRGHLGINVGDPQSYGLFKEYFDEVLKEIHPNIDCSYKPFDGSILQDKTNSYRVRLARNVKGFPLPPAMTSTDRLKLLEKVETVVQSLGEKYIQYKDLDHPSNEENLPSWYFFSKGDEYYDTSGLNNDWPVGRSVFYFSEMHCVLWVGEEDHLRVFCHQQEGDFLTTFTNASNLASQLEQALGFCKSDDLGYLTTCPTNLGTGMRISIHYKLPHGVSIEKIQELAKPLSLSIRGTNGERSESIGGIVDISNTYRHSKAPEEFFHYTWSSICNLIQDVEVL